MPKLGFFYDMMGDEINEAIDATRRQGVVPDCLNLTYITLIPKKDKPVTFNAYRSIYFCNLIYKFITKLITERIMPILGNHILDEQYGFLPNRQILDVVGISQECLHSVKKKKLTAFILKLDMEKAYDQFDSSFI